MDALERLVAESEIAKLKSRYFRLMDEQRWPQWRALFTHDLVFEAVGYDLRIDGGDAFVAHVSSHLKGAVTVHHGHMGAVDAIAPDRATGWWALADYVEYPADSATASFKGYAYYDEEYRCTDGVWRIAAVRLTYQRMDTLATGNGAGALGA
jgi:hypothetical protein